ncbi:group 1 truncated hemoglobin [Marinobacter nanhaiticus D15-8W]|uniref:Group 1 truncated hemoglobin n=1 Tax=Marinobacter nanhaiticus D15-8W TaxID=626887 RepID=N6VYG5_9GAMM|nr:group 1 truncated hemoglobin [Marinobacter nanhaiticus]ENO15285.1 group 1 truncated hemoglobin [Marinobacter nanhaiticus D15-8W]BES69012.1 group 1 truncated hemoglobin [Marinobacter nanhaiticus D15-8W]
MVNRLLPLLFLVMLSGCQSLPPQSSPSLYDALGERKGIALIVKDLLYIVVEDERIAEKFRAVDIAGLHRNLTDQICALADGPCTYSGRGMSASHAGLGINETHFNALAEDLILAMEQNGVPVSAQNQLLARLVRLHDDIVFQPAARPIDTAP